MAADRAIRTPWTVEAPGGACEHFAKLADCRRMLASLMAPAPMVPLKRLATGCYRYDPPIVRVERRQLGPWLIYNARGRRYLVALEQPSLPFETDTAARVPRGGHDAV